MTIDPISSNTSTGGTTDASVQAAGGPPNHDLFVLVLRRAQSSTMFDSNNNWPYVQLEDPDGVPTGEFVFDPTLFVRDLVVQIDRFITSGDGLPPAIGLDEPIANRGAEAVRDELQALVTWMETAAPDDVAAFTDGILALPEIQEARAQLAETGEISDEMYALMLEAINVYLAGLDSADGSV